MLNVPIVWQYVIMAGVALALTLVGLWLYNRREKRRKHAIELMKLMNRWGLDWFAEVYEMYSVGDYSGLVHKVREIVTAIRSDEAMIGKLGEVAKKVATYYAQNDPTKAKELRAILEATVVTSPVAKTTIVT
jgi:hypothetical protein